MPDQQMQPAPQPPITPEVMPAPEIPQPPASAAAENPLVVINANIIDVAKGIASLMGVLGQFHGELQARLDQIDAKLRKIETRQSRQRRPRAPKGGEA